MKLELHIVQSFPPANLNRDENGMPKSTVFGGRPRARISSQCQKRAVRKYYQQYADIDRGHFAQRSRGWLPKLTALLIDSELPEPKAQIAAKLALESLGAKFKDGKIESDTILFLGDTEIQTIAAIIVKHWHEMESGLLGDKPALPTKEPNLSKVIEKSLAAGSKPGDVALFGRMMASLPTISVDAAVQMAHAISINRLQQEFDFFTAVDDLSASDDQGADHIGETGYNSSTYYRFTNLDLEQLKDNLGSEDQVLPIAKAFSEAFIKAIPSGHQNSFAAQSLPALIMITVRKGQPVSLVDAFECPIRAGEMSLLANGVQALGEHWEDIIAMYGEAPVKYKGVVTRKKLVPHLGVLEGALCSSTDELLDQALAACELGA